MLLLDEPTAGLDPAQTLGFRALVKDIACPGGVVISTHQISDLVDDVDRVVILADGRIMFDGTPAGFVQQHVSAAGGATTLAEAFSAIVGGGRH